MASPSKNGILSFYIKGVNYTVPVDWRAITFNVSFPNGNVQGSIESDLIELAGEGANAVLQHRNEGLTGGVGVFEGLPVQGTIG